MSITDLQLKEFAQVNPHLVSHRASKRYPDLSVLKYKHKVFYDNLWTPELQEMRGLVVDRDWNVVVRPFTKVFNRFENGTDIHRDEEVTAVRKVNGFLGCATWHRTYGLIVSTTGSLDSDFVKLAEKWLLPYYDQFSRDESNTWMFEIVDESDPHIIEEPFGAYLIGARDIVYGDLLPESRLDEIASRFGWKRPESVVTNFGNVVEMTKRCRHEGFMVYGKETVLKIKSPYYLTKKFFARVKPEKLTPNWLEANRGNFDEEFYGLIDHISAHRDEFTAMDQECRKVFIEEYLNV